MVPDNIGAVVDKAIGMIFVKERENVHIPFISVSMRDGKHVLTPVSNRRYDEKARKIVDELARQGEITSVSPMVRRKGSPEDDYKRCGYACLTARPGDDLYVYVAVDNINFWHGLPAVYEPNEQ